jgi:hypothetical protein
MEHPALELLKDKSSPVAFVLYFAFLFFSFLFLFGNGTAATEML